MLLFLNVLGLILAVPRILWWHEQPGTIAMNAYYFSQITTSVNYSIGMKAAYRLNGYWLIGGFFDFDNSLNYTSTNAGFYVRYQFHPTSPQDKPGDLPGWNEIRSLILPAEHSDPAQQKNWHLTALHPNTFAARPHSPPQVDAVYKSPPTTFPHP